MSDEGKTRGRPASEVSEGRGVRELPASEATQMQAESQRDASPEELQQETAELERFNRLAVGREMRMIELRTTDQRTVPGVGQGTAL